MSISGFSRAVVGPLTSVAMLSACGGGSGAPLNPSLAGPSTALRMTTAERTRVPSSYEVLYSFSGGSDGAGPSAALTNVNAMLYGTTEYGGGDGCSRSSGCGTVYSLTASGKETVLYSFKGGSADGAHPLASLLNVNGTLYGTTSAGGVYGDGTVFAITRSGKETVLYSFKGGRADGAQPLAPLLNVNGMLYGTTAAGGSGSSCGSSGCGTVFSITTSGTETVLHSFKGGTTDGQNPYAGLINVGGTLYGTTDGGGLNCKNGFRDCGTIFAITLSGKETVRYSFKGGTTDGQNPEAALIYAKGKLYGTTTGAGRYNRGTVFATTTSGTETVLHSFGRRYDAAVPQAALLDMNGMLYGTTTSGGGSGHYAAVGTVFEISISGNERVLHYFDHSSGDGYVPVASLINVKGTLYGTTQVGGSGGYCLGTYTYSGCGTVFTLRPQ